MGPVSGDVRKHLAHTAGVNEKFPGCDGAAAPYSRCYNHILVRVGIHKSGDNSVILVGASLLLLRSIEQPVPLGRVRPILNPESGHLWIVGKVVAKRRRES